MKVNQHSCTTNPAHPADLKTTLDDIRMVTLIDLGVGIMNMGMVAYLVKNLLP